MKTGSGVLLFVTLTFSAFAQTDSDSSKTTPPVSVPTPVLQNGVPYGAQEFPPWERSLRRFEILAVGAFPIAYLFSGIGFDYYYYFSNGFPNANIPWPLGPGTGQWIAQTQPMELQKKNITMVSVSLAASLVVAVADWALGL